jgi:hypothetical protein
MAAIDEICGCSYEAEGQVCTCVRRKQQARSECNRCLDGRHALTERDQQVLEGRTEMSKQSKDGVVIAAKAKAAIPSRAAKPRKRQLGDPRADLPGPPQLSEEERKRLEDHAALTAKVRPVAKAKYEVDVMFSMLERALQDYKADYGLNLLPDFQRGHKWSEEQQILFVESVLRGAVTTAGLLIQFNLMRCSVWMASSA